MFSFGLSSVISKVSVADSDHVFVYWKRYFRTGIIITVILITKRLSGLDLLFQILMFYYWDIMGLFSFSFS